MTDNDTFNTIPDCDGPGDPPRLRWRRGVPPHGIGDVLTSDFKVVSWEGSSGDPEDEDGEWVMGACVFILGGPIRWIALDDLAMLPDE